MKMDQSADASQDVPNHDSKARRFWGCSNYQPPSKLLAENQILKLACDEGDVTDDWWEIKDPSNNSFLRFIDSDLFINKFSYIDVITKTPLKSKAYGVFFPTGCGKTVMSVALEHFFSFQVPAAKREALRPFYKNELCDSTLTEHEGSYYVLSISFRNFPRLTEDISFAMQFAQFLQDYMLVKEPSVALIEIDGNFFHNLLRHIYNKYEKLLIVIVDEVDIITNACILEKISSKREKEVRFLSRRKWQIHYFLTKEKAKFFMFDRSEVLKILNAHQMSHQINEVHKHYGNYVYDYFLPSSIISFVKCKKFYLFKWSRRSIDIMDLNVREIEIWLAPFIDNCVHKIDIALETHCLTQKLNEEHLALYQYAYAGLLKLNVPENNDMSHGTFDMSIGNTENLNLVAKFLEDTVDADSINNRVEEAQFAMDQGDFDKLADIFTEIFTSYNPVFLISEKHYQNPMYLFFRFLKNWEVKTEYDENSINVKTDESGRADLRAINDRLHYLYIFELKFIKAKEIGKNDKKLEDMKNKAFKQIERKGYITKSDEVGYKKIMEIATICHGKKVTMYAREHVNSCTV